MIAKKILIHLFPLLFASLAFAQDYNIERVSKAIEDMSKNPSYPKQYAEKLAKFKANKSSANFQKDFNTFARQALLANPLLQKSKDWIFIKRDASVPFRGLPFNWQSNALLNNLGNYNAATYPRTYENYKDELWTMDITKPESAKLFYKPTDTLAITDVDVNWDGDKVLYSAINPAGQWQIYELDLKTKKRRLMTVEKYEDVDNFDGVYLPDGNMIYMSTACYAAVPCVGGTDFVANLYKINPNLESEDARDDTIRQISFDQENSWSPTVFNDGKVMFTRWEYTDNSHYFSRILMKMNPDGSGQMSHYGSTSYWPNSLFYCRPISEDSNKFIAIVSGHHEERRSGELHLFDISNGVIEDQGRVHQYMGMGKEYVPRMMDNLVGDVKLHFIHPYPLSENYIIVSLQDRNTKDAKFSLYLVDKFDNATLLLEDSKFDLFEPMPLAARERPPIIAEKVDEDLDFGYVFLNNIYEGPGLKGVEKGVVKKLRVFEYNYTYRYMGGHEMMGLESGWEVKRIHGTVDVEPDGSAMFKVPANRPYSIQPLDKDGKALALFRSWMTVRAGETLSCVGCHEPSNSAPVLEAAMAAKKPPQNLTAFLGKPRGFSYAREIQPILDNYCIECHNGDKKNLPNFKAETKPWKGQNYTNSYLALHPYVRRPGPESNQNILSPLEFHSSTSELIQRLEKGHHGVNLDDDSKRVILTWIDLNVPFSGTLTEANTDKNFKGTFKPYTDEDIAKINKNSGSKTAQRSVMKRFRYPMLGIPYDQEAKRAFFLKKYANRHDYNYESTDILYKQAEYINYNKKRGETLSHKNATKPSVTGYPFDAETAKAMKEESGLAKEIKISLNAKTKISLVLIPAGSYIQGSNDSFYDEGPAKLTEIKKPFYMSKVEITNEIYAAFDAEHDSGYLDRHWKDHVNQGYPANEPNMPVIRISYEEAQAFCDWLSKKSNRKVSLPTEAQWEWAARAGSDKDFHFGNASDDFTPFENFAGKETSNFAVKGVNPKPMKNPLVFYTYFPADRRKSDGSLLQSVGAKYKPNAFGLYDMGGNVAEWVQDTYSKTLGGEIVEDKAVARGGSWADRPSFAKTTIRRPFYKWQKVYNVGFRIIVD